MFSHRQKLIGMAHPFVNIKFVERSSQLIREIYTPRKNQLHGRFHIDVDDLVQAWLSIVWDWEVSTIQVFLNSVG